MMAQDIAPLMNIIAKEEVENPVEPFIKGAFSYVENKESPFGYKKGEGIDEGAGDNEWVVNKLRPDTDAVFKTLGPVDEKITSAAAKSEMIKSKLPNTVLGKIWKLADVDKDGMMDPDEFALAMHLINVKLDGHDLPTELPAHLVPPSKRVIDTLEKPSIEV